MKKALLFIIVFVIIGILSCAGVISQNPALACIGVIASAILGSLISIVFTSIDKHGQGWRLWFQHIRYRKKDVRLSFSYLFKIEVDGKYLLVKGNRLKKQYQPVGGVYKYYDEAKLTLESFKFRPDVKMGNTSETDDLRIFIEGRYLLLFMNWFKSMRDREYDPTREFKEELIASKLLPESAFSKFEYRKIYTHDKGVEYSTFMQCDEIVYADIFEIKLSDSQKAAIRQAVEEHPDMLCLATADELKCECYNGIEKNLGNNAKWLLGE